MIARCPHPGLTANLVYVEERPPETSTAEETQMFPLHDRSMIAAHKEREQRMIEAAHNRRLAKRLRRRRRNPR